MVELAVIVGVVLVAFVAVLIFCCSIVCVSGSSRGSITSCCGGINNCLAVVLSVLVFIEVVVLVAGVVALNFLP